MSSDGWERVRLGDLVSINSISISASYPHNVIEYIDTSSVTRNEFIPPQPMNLRDAPSRARRIVNHGDTILSTVRPIQRHYGFIRNPKPNTVVSTGFAVITPKSINAEFLYYYLSQESITNYLNSVAETSTTTFPAFRPEILSELEIEIPKDQATQSRIADILSTLDDKIELNRQTNATLEAIAQAIFKEWFVDFNYPGATGEMVDSELGPIPKGWRVKPLDEIAEFLNGLALQKYPPENETEYLPVIKIRELRNGVTESSDRASRKLPKEYIVEDGDLLFSWSGSLEVMFWVGGEGALNQHLFKVTSKDYPLWFCYHWILHHLTDFRSIAEEKTTTMGHIKREHLSNALCIIPDNIDLLDAIIQPIFSKMLLNDKESQLLSKTRELLLPELMIKRMEF